MDASLAKISGSWCRARSLAWMCGANSRAQNSRTVSTSCSWSGVSARSSISVTRRLLLVRARRRAGFGCGRRGRRHGLEVARAHVADERKVVADAEDERHGLRAVQLRLQKVRVDLLE